LCFRIFRLLQGFQNDVAEEPKEEASLLTIVAMSVSRKFPMNPI